MKNVNEIRKFVRKGFDTGNQIAEDGIGYDDIGKVISLIDPGKDAIEDAAQYGAEIGAASNKDMDESDLQVEGLLGSFSLEDQRDLDAIEKGIVAVTRKIARAKQEGIAEGKQLVLNQLKTQGFDISTLEV